MRIRLSIGAKIGLGFGTLLLAFLINSYLTNDTLSKSIEINEKVMKVYSPSTAALNNLRALINDSKMLIKSWVFIDKKEDTSDKLNLIKLHQETYPKIESSLKKISEEWNETEQLKADQIILKEILDCINDTLFPHHKYIMNKLSTFESYDDPFIMFEVIPMVEEGGEIINLTNQLMAKLSKLIDSQEREVEKARKQMDQSFNSLRNLIIILAGILVFFTIIIALLTIRSLSRPINHIKAIILSMAKGILPEKTLTEGKDEIGQMSRALNALIKGLKDISEFSVQIGKGNFDSEFTPLSEQDTLGNALIEMRRELKNAAEEETKRKKEDEQRNWATQGLAKFAEILRQNNDNMEELAYNVISNLVKYLEANQGGLFIINNEKEDEVFIEMKACYAYNRQKFLTKRLEIGEGLVGRCVQERDTIYLTDIPIDYITITSGLGDDNPRSLLIIPLAVNEEIFGVLEIASFKEFAPYQIEFVERIGESIASTISTVKINIQTTLLLEQSKQQAEEMASQEEEMRQNMEELRATQEQSARRETELQKALDECKSKLKKYTTKK